MNQINTFTVMGNAWKSTNIQVWQSASRKFVGKPCLGSILPTAATCEACKPTSNFSITSDLTSFCPSSWCFRMPSWHVSPAITRPLQLHRADRHAGPYLGKNRFPMQVGGCYLKCSRELGCQTQFKRSWPQVLQAWFHKYLFSQDI